jgi:hypothetical protein
MMRNSLTTLAAAILSIYYLKTQESPLKLNLIIKPLVQAINFERSSIIVDISVQGLFGLIQVFFQ